MARQKGLVKIEGTLDDITFFRRKDAYLVRNKGGVNKERIMNDPAFIRTRENGVEFKTVAMSGKMLRESVNVFSRKAYDGTLSNRLVQLLSKVKNNDTTSLRGERQVYIGMTKAEAKQLMKGFDFNNRSSLGSVLFAPYTLDVVSGEVEIIDLVPLDMLKFPSHSTHVSFQSGFLNLNLETGESQITYSPIVNLPLDMSVSSVTLTPSAPPTGTGFKFYLLLIEFFQEVNGVQYALNNGSYNVLNLLEVV